MAHPQNPPDVLAALLEDVLALRMEQTVQRAAYVALARHLAVQGQASLPALAQDLQMLAQAQTEAAAPGWQSGLQGLAGLLLSADALPAKARPERGPALQ